jgi:hypothetical protein
LVCASKPSGLLFVGCATKPTGGVARMVHVASLWMSRGDEAENERVDAMSCIGLFYTNFAIFFVLGHKGSLVTKG